jgi:hypothetical protein
MECVHVAMANIRIKVFRYVKPVINFALSVMDLQIKVVYNVIHCIIENLSMENVSACQATITTVRVQFVYRSLKNLSQLVIILFFFSINLINFFF